MARAITAPELVKLRSDMQGSKLFLAILKPNTIYSARVNGVPASTDLVSEIEYDGGSGTLADVKAGMSLYVGTSAGAYDLGILRIRKDPDANTFFFGEVSEVDWAEDAYLTVVDDFGLRVKPPKQSGAAWKMDTDVTYSDEHTNFDPVPMMGPHAVAWLTGATVDALFDASDSWVIGSSISSYAWTAPGASASSGMATATPTITYNAAGIYRVYCTVTAANGKSFMGVRHVFVYSAASMPVTAFQLKSNPRGDVDSGGWSCDVTLYDEAALADVREGALAILFSRDWFGGTEASQGPVANRENIVMAGWIAGESIVWDTEGGSVDFTIQNAAAWMQRMAAYPLALKFAKVTAAAWNQMPQMTVDKALFHLLHWRSNVTQIMDVTLTGDTRLLPDTSAGGNSLWAQLGEIGNGKIFARPGVDRFGRLFIQIDPQMVEEADRTWATVMTVTKADYEERIIPRRQMTTPSSMLAMSAMEVNTSGKANTRYSLAMGHVHLRQGQPEVVDKYLCESQAQANTQSGLLLGWKNNEWPEIPILLAQNNRFIDCWPQQFLALTLAADETPRNKAFAGNIIPRAVELVWDAEAGSFQTSLTCEAETFPTLAVDGDIPGSDISIPPEPPPPPPPPPGGGGNEDHPTDVLIATSNFGLMYSQDFDEDSPHWFFMNAGLTEFERENVERIVRCPNGVLLIGIQKELRPNEIGAIYWAPGLGGTWQKMLDYTDLDQGTYDEPAIVAFGASQETGEKIFVVGGGYTGLAIGDKSTYVGTHDDLTFVNGTLDIQNHMGDVSYLLGGWLLTRNTASALSPKGGSLFYPSGGLWGNATFPTPHSYQGKSFHWAGGGKVFLLEGSNYLRIIENLDVLTEIFVSLSNFGREGGALAVDPTGTYLMGCDGTIIGQRSSDGGYTWGPIGTAGGMSIGYDVWENCRTALRFLAGAGNIMLTLDWGDNWINKNGDLLTLAPLVDITLIKYVAG